MERPNTRPIYLKSSYQQNNERVPIRTSENEKPSLLERLAILFSYVLLIVFFPVAIFLSLVTTPEYQRVVIFRCGRLRKGGARGPGLIFVLPCVDKYVRVDLRTTSFDVAQQTILTKDAVTIRVDAVVYYRVEDPLRAVIQVLNPFIGTQLLAQTTLRNIVGKKMLVELLTAKSQLSQDIGEILDKATDPWGIKVERVEIKEIGMPSELQRAMAAEQEAAREAKAKIAAADGELNSSKVLKEASDTMARNPMSLQLRYLQTLNTVSAEKNHTIVLPIPMDIIRSVIASGAGGSNGGASGGRGDETAGPSKAADQSTSRSELVERNEHLQSNPNTLKDVQATQTSFESVVDMAELPYDVVATKAPTEEMYFRNTALSLLNSLSSTISSPNP